MKTILVTKYGLVFRRVTTSVGEQGETEAMLRHLVARDVNVVYFGQWVGDHIPEVTVVEPHIGDLDDIATAEEQRRGFQKDIESLGALDIKGFIMSCGYAPTASMIDNATGASVQSVAVRCCAPALNVLNHFGMPRLLINSDPRTLPRDAEITDLPHTRPVALLDQWNRESLIGIRGTRYKRRSIYAGIECWPDIRALPFPGVRNSSVVVAHAHVYDGMRSGESLMDAWDEILRGTDALVYGKGWDLTMLRGDRFQGNVSVHEALWVLANATSGPIVSHTPRFATLKLKTYVSQGCVPLLWSRGPHTYDPLCRCVPRDHYLRFHSAEELRDRTKELHSNPRIVAQSLEFLQEATKPNWTVLDALVDEVLAGREPSWLDFGGYK